MIFYLYGQDSWRIREKSLQIKEKFLKQVKGGNLNLIQLDGSKINWGDLRGNLMSASFLADKKMIIINDLIFSGNFVKFKDDLLLLLDNLKESKDIFVVFVETKSKGGRASSLENFLKKLKYAQEFKTLNPSQVDLWLQREIKKREGAISPTASRLLVSLVGNDLELLSNELDKLIAYKKNKEITEKDVKLMVRASLDEDIFKLVDSLALKNKKLVIKLIADQLAADLSPQMLLAMIIRQYRLILQIKDIIESESGRYPSYREISQNLKLHPFVVQKVYNQTKYYTIPQLKKIYQRLINLDFKLKTSRLSPEALFDLLVIKI